MRSAMDWYYAFWPVVKSLYMAHVHFMWRVLSSRLFFWMMAIFGSLYATSCLVFTGLKLLEFTLGEVKSKSGNRSAQHTKNNPSAARFHAVPSDLSNRPRDGEDDCKPQGYHAHKADLS